MRALIFCLTVIISTVSFRAKAGTDFASDLCRELVSAEIVHRADSLAPLIASFPRAPGVSDSLSMATVRVSYPLKLESPLGFIQSTARRMGLRIAEGFWEERTFGQTRRTEIVLIGPPDILRETLIELAQSSRWQPYISAALVVTGAAGRLPQLLAQGEIVNMARATFATDLQRLFSQDPGALKVANLHEHAYLFVRAPIEPWRISRSARVQTGGQNKPVIRINVEELTLAAASKHAEARGQAFAAFREALTGVLKGEQRLVLVERNREIYELASVGEWVLAQNLFNSRGEATYPHRVASAELVGRILTCAGCRPARKGGVKSADADEDADGDDDDSDADTESETKAPAPRPSRGTKRAKEPKPTNPTLNGQANSFLGTGPRRLPTAAVYAKYTRLTEPDSPLGITPQNPTVTITYDHAPYVWLIDAETVATRSRQDIERLFREALSSDIDVGTAQLIEAYKSDRGAFERAKISQLSAKHGPTTLQRRTPLVITDRSETRDLFLYVPLVR